DTLRAGALAVGSGRSAPSAGRGLPTRPRDRRAQARDRGSGAHGGRELLAKPTEPGSRPVGRGVAAGGDDRRPGSAGYSAERGRVPASSTSAARRGGRAVQPAAE